MVSPHKKEEMFCCVTVAMERMQAINYLGPDKQWNFVTEILLRTQNVTNFSFFASLYECWFKIRANISQLSHGENTKRTISSLSYKLAVCMIFLAEKQPMTIEKLSPKCHLLSMHVHLWQILPLSLHATTEVKCDKIEQVHLDNCLP